MSFEENLPSLVKDWRSAEDFPKDYIVVPVLDVSRKCLDKEIIKSVIMEMMKKNNSVMIDGMTLKKQLGLYRPAY